MSLVVGHLARAVARLSAVAQRWSARRASLGRWALVCEAWGSLPADLRERTAHVPLVVRSRPSESDVARGVPPHVAGAFIQTGDDDPDQERAAGEVAVRTGLVVIYVDNCQPRTVEGVAHVLTHELTHVLGYDGHDVETCS